jgi:transcriptional regulator
MYIPKHHEESDLKVLHSLIKAHPLGAWVIQSEGEHGKAVPTWNYAVVHAHGIPKAVEDRDGLLAILTQLTNEHESKQALPWNVSDAPQDFTDQLMQAIVGIEIPIDKLVGKWKVHQHRSDAEKLGVVAGLQGRGDSQSDDMATLVRKHIAGVTKR